MNFTRPDFSMSIDNGSLILEKRPTKGRTSLPRCRITGTTSVYQRPEKRQHNPSSPKENPSEQGRDKRQNRKSVPFASTERRGQLRDGARCDERQSHKSVSFASTTERATKLWKHICFLPGKSALLVHRRSHKMQRWQGKRQRNLTSSGRKRPRVRHSSSKNAKSLRYTITTYSTWTLSDYKTAGKQPVTFHGMTPA